FARRRRAAVIRQVKRDDAKAAGDFGIVQHMAPLPAIGARGVQAEERNAIACLLEEDAAGVGAHVAPDDGFVLRHQLRMRFIMRCRARAFCIASRPSPSSTNCGTRMSMAKKS